MDILPLLGFADDRIDWYWAWSESGKMDMAASAVERCGYRGGVVQ